MHFCRVAIIFFICLLLCITQVKSESHGRFAIALHQFNIKNYSKAFDLFNAVCDNYNGFAGPCIMMAFCYQSGLGVKQDLAKASQIYYRTMNDTNNCLDERMFAAFLQAQLLEYELGDNPESLTEAQDIYRNLEKMNYDETIIEDMNVRFKEYEFIDKFFPQIIKFNLGEISPQEFQDALDKANFTLLPLETAKKFLALKRAYYAYLKSGSNFLSSDELELENAQKRDDVIEKLENLFVHLLAVDHISENWLLSFSLECLSLSKH